MIQLRLNFLLLIITIIFITLNKLPLINARKFKIYWNVPTFLCHPHGMMFEEISQKYNMIQNTNDTFRGDKMAILYHSGYFPSYIKFPHNNTFLSINGRVPQKGNLQRHLNKLQKDLDNQIAVNFSGLGVLDYERWEPIFRQNSDKMRSVYKKYSVRIEQKKFPQLTRNQVTKLAEKALENAGRTFYEETIKLVKKRRPLALWAYYDYPKCYNLRQKKPSAQCESIVQKDNDRLEWLWDQSDVLLPSIYISTIHANTGNIPRFINGRLNEARRIALKYFPMKSIFPYLRYRYKNAREEFLKYEDYIEIFAELLRQNVDGFVLWGSDKDVNTRDKCINLLYHLHEVIGPAMKRFNL